MRELSANEVNEVSGGGNPVVAIGVVIGIIVGAMEIGRGAGEYAQREYEVNVEEYTCS